MIELILGSAEEEVGERQSHLLGLPSDLPSTGEPPAWQQGPPALTLVVSTQLRTQLTHSLSISFALG